MIRKWALCHSTWSKKSGVACRIAVLRNRGSSNRLVNIPLGSDSAAGLSEDAIPRLTNRRGLDDHGWHPSQANKARGSLTWPKSNGNGRFGLLQN